MALPHSMWDLRSPTRDQTHIACQGSPYTKEFKTGTQTNTHSQMSITALFTWPKGGSDPNTHQLMNEWKVQCIHKWNIYKKEWHADTCYNMDETWKYDAKWNSPIVWLHVYWTSRIGKSNDTENSRRKGMGGGTVSWVWSLLWGRRNVSELDRVMAAHLWMYYSCWCSGSVVPDSLRPHGL